MPSRHHHGRGSPLLRRTLRRVLIISAALSGFAAFAAPAVFVAPAVFAAQPPTALRDCGTEVQGSAGTGWCSGTGSFRVQVNCADGTSMVSGRAILQDGYAQMSLGCARSAASSAQIVVLDNPPQ